MGLPVSRNTVGFPGGTVVKNLPANAGDARDEGSIPGCKRWGLDPWVQEMRVWFLGWQDPQEWEIAARCSILAWKMPWIDEPGGIQSNPWGHKELDTTQRLSTQRCTHAVERWKCHVNIWLSLCPWKFMPDGTTCVTKYYGVIKHIYQQENIKLFFFFIICLSRNSVSDCLLHPPEPG